MFWALVGALGIGASLGLLGSGGSILTVPVLTYVLGQDEKLAIAGSLAVVGTISLIAGLPFARRGLVDGRSVVWFGLSGMLGSWSGAALAAHVSGTVQMLAFALLALVAAVHMLRSARPRPNAGPPEQPPPEQPRAAKTARRPALRIAIDGLAVGVVTGFVGVGGGFMIVPALVLLGGLSMSLAVGTSLFVIAMNSAAGFAKHLDVLSESGISLDWPVLGIFAFVGVLGSVAGRAFGGRLSDVALRRGFGAFLAAVGLFILVRSGSELLTA